MEKALAGSSPPRRRRPYRRRAPPRRRDKPKPPLNAGYHHARLSVDEHLADMLARPRRRTILLLSSLFFIMSMA